MNYAVGQNDEGTVQVSQKIAGRNDFS